MVLEVERQEFDNTGFVIDDKDMAFQGFLLRREILHTGRRLATGGKKGLTAWGGRTTVPPRLGVEGYMASIRTLKDLAVEGRRVLLRVDLDGVVDEDGAILDDSRITGLLPTIQELQRREARIILATGMGKPKGKREPKVSVESVAARLAELLEAREDEVVFSEEPVGDGPRHQAQSMKEGHLLVLENLRFHSGEMANDESFGRALASLGEVFVHDGFASMGLAHASTVGVTRHLRERCVGLQVEKEIAGLRKLTERPVKPYVAIVGARRLADMGSLLLSLIPQVDVLCVGGEAALALLWAKGIHVGLSAPDAESLSAAEKILRRSDKREAMQLLVPVDLMGIRGDEVLKSIPANEVPSQMIATDIGEKSIEQFRAAIEKAKTLFWCGSLGLGDGSNDKGTGLVGKAIARSSAYSVVGGPDSLAAIRRAGVAPFIHHLSTGGEATLHFLEGKALPGLTALMD